METYTNQIKEWTDYENQYKIALAAVKRLDKNLHIVHGKRERNVELTYGLPYTSSGEYAAIWNTNVDARNKDDSSLQFKGMALDKDNNPVIIWHMTDCDGWKYETILNCTDKNGTLEENPEWIGDAKVLDSLAELPKVGEKDPCRGLVVSVELYDDRKDYAIYRVYYLDGRYVDKDTDIAYWSYAIHKDDIQ